MLDYKNDTKIDPDALDVEWLGQIELGRRYAQHSAKMTKLAKEAKERLEVLEAELSRTVMLKPKKTTGKDNPARHDIDAYIRTRKEYREAKQELIDAEYEAHYADMVQKEVSIGRKKALEDLVTLFVHQYFSSPNIGHDIADAWKKRQRREKSDDLVDEALNKKRKK